MQCLIRFFFYTFMMLTFDGSMTATSPSAFLSVVTGLSGFQSVGLGGRTGAQGSSVGGRRTGVGCRLSVLLLSVLLLSTSSTPSSEVTGPATVSL